MVGLAAVLGGCATDRPLPDLAVLLFQRAQAPHGDAALTTAAVDLLEGRSREEAIAIPSDGGFTCSATTCAATSFIRISWFETRFGVTLVNEPAIIEQRLAVKILGDPIDSPWDLTATYVRDVRPMTRP